MDTLIVVYAVIGAISVSLFMTALVSVTVLLVARKRSNDRLAANSLQETDERSGQEEDEGEYTLETLMEQNNGPTYMAVSLHELFRTFRAAGFTQEEAYGLVQNALYASILANSE